MTEVRLSLYPQAMNTRVDTIVEEARKLTPEEQRELLTKLLELEEGEADGTPEEIEAAWLEEVKRRIEKAEKGETTFSDLDDVLAKAHDRLRRGGGPARRAAAPGQEGDARRRRAARARGAAGNGGPRQVSRARVNHGL